MASQFNKQRDYTAVEMEEKKEKEREEARESPQQQPKTEELEKPFDDEFWQKVSYQVHSMPII